jgi:hypothetical protein
MNHSPNNFNFDDDGFKFPYQEEENTEELQNLSSESIQRLSAHKKQLQRLLIYLAGLGLGLGLLLAVVLVFALNKLGLTKKPDEIPVKEDVKLEKIKYIPEKPVQKLNLSFTSFKS